MRCGGRRRGGRSGLRAAWAAALLLALLPVASAESQATGSATAAEPEPEEDSGGGSRLWIGVRGDYFSGSSELFTQYDNPIGGGIDIGLGFGAFTLSAEALIMGQGQWLFDVNLGAEWLFEEGIRYAIGLFTGPMFFLFPEEETKPVDFSVLSAGDQQALLDATGFASIVEAEAEFDESLQQADQLSQLAVGWNILRLRLAADVPLGPIYLGLAGQLGYHLLLDGEEVAAGLKNRALNDYAQQFGLTDELADQMADAIDAHPVDRSKLDGFNWDVNLYVRLEF